MRPGAPDADYIGAKSDSHSTPVGTKMENNPQQTIGESERWFSVIAGGMLVLSSLRQRDAASGALFALGGSALIFRGMVGHDGVFAALRDALTGDFGD